MQHRQKTRKLVKILRNAEAQNLRCHGTVQKRRLAERQHKSLQDYTTPVFNLLENLAGARRLCRDADFANQISLSIMNAINRLKNEIVITIKTSISHETQLGP